MKDTYKVPKSLKKKLQAAVDYLTEHPEKIPYAWAKPNHRKGGCLFRIAHPDGVGRKFMLYRKDHLRCGCLTQIKGNYRHGMPAYTSTLTKEIRADKRLPRNAEQVTVDHLPIFQEWMLRLAVEFRWKS